MLKWYIQGYFRLIQTEHFRSFSGRFRSYEWTLSRESQLDERNIKRIFNKMIVKNSWSSNLKSQWSSRIRRSSKIENNKENKHTWSILNWFFSKIQNILPVYHHPILGHPVIMKLIRYKFEIMSWLLVAKISYGLMKKSTKFRRFSDRQNDILPISARSRLVKNVKALNLYFCNVIFWCLGYKMWQTVTYWCISMVTIW